MLVRICIAVNQANQRCPLQASSCVMAWINSTSAPHCLLGFSLRTPHRLLVLSSCLQIRYLFAYPYCRIFSDPSLSGIYVLRQKASSRPAFQIYPVCTSVLRKRALCRFQILVLAHTTSLAPHTLPPQSNCRETLALRVCELRFPNVRLRRTGWQSPILQANPSGKRLVPPRP